MSHQPAANKNETDSGQSGQCGQCGQRTVPRLAARFSGGCMLSSERPQIMTCVGCDHHADGPKIHYPLGSQPLSLISVDPFAVDGASFFFFGGNQGYRLVGVCRCDDAATNWVYAAPRASLQERKSNQQGTDCGTLRSSDQHFYYISQSLKLILGHRSLIVIQGSQF